MPIKNRTRDIPQNLLHSKRSQQVVHFISKLTRALLLVSLIFASSCLPTPPADTGGAQITVYGFSIMKEVMEKEIYPKFAAKWKREHGEDVKFTSSFAGSETITNQILQGVGADVAVVAIERDAERLRAGGFITTDWHGFPNKGIINKTPFVIVTRKGNPKGIRDFDDLSKPNVNLIHPDPVSSGGAQWSILAIYGSELVKSEKESGERDEARALRNLQAIWRRVISTPGSAREARTQFELGNGDAFITYEQDALLMKQANAAVEIIAPQATIFSEHPAIIIDRNVTSQERPVVNAFVEYLWSEEAQRAFVQYNFRAATDESLNAANKDLMTIKNPFTIEYFGGWNRAYPEVIEKIWRDRVQRTK